MAIDLAVDLMHATVQLEQPLGDGTRTVGTGFLISDPTPDGRPRTILVTAKHVLAGMPGRTATIGYRVENPDGSWAYSPQPVQIRDATARRRLSVVMNASPQRRPSGANDLGDRALQVVAANPVDPLKRP